MRFVEETIAVPTDVGNLAGILRRPERAVHVPGVVLVDGSGSGTADGWGGWPEWIGDCGAVVLRHDKPGCGASPGDWRQQDFESRADESLAAARVLRAANGGGPVGLAGFSQGGWVALLAAARDPAAVDFVVSVSGPGVTPKRQERARIERDLRRRGLDEADRQDALAWVDERAHRLLAGEPVAAILADQERARDRPWFEAVTFAGYEDAGTLGFAARILDFDPLPVAARVRCPVLVLLGGADDVVPVAESVAAFGPVLPGLGEGSSGLAVFPNGNHGLYVADPDPDVPRKDQLAPGVLPMIAGFLASVAATAPPR